MEKENKVLIEQIKAKLAREILLNDFSFEDKNFDSEVHQILLNCLFIKTGVQSLAFKDADFLNPFLKHFDFLERLNLSEQFEVADFIQNHYLQNSLTIKGGKISMVSSKKNSKEFGIYYTPFGIVEHISSQTFDYYFKEKESIPIDFRLLDFGGGTGRFYIAAFQKLVEEYGVNPLTAIKEMLYAVDIDSIAISILKWKITLLLTKKYNIEEVGQDIFGHIILDNALMQNNLLFFEISNGTKLKNNFFDIILSNPPYLVLKVNGASKDDSLKDYKNRIQEEVKFFKSSSIYTYSISGMLNYYKLSIERMIQLCKTKGFLGIICPSSLFGDMSSLNLRKYILNRNKLIDLQYFGEQAKFFENVSQSTCIFFLQKNEVTTNFIFRNSEETFNITLKEVKEAFPQGLEIPPLQKLGWSIIRKLNGFQKVKELSFLRNKRGELDLSLHKDFITKQESEWCLVRGNMIQENKLNYSKGSEFVLEEFFSKKSEDYLQKDFGKPRLVCQQIANVDSKKRLKFAICGDTDILGNSCNYISVQNDMDIKILLAFFNSYILNWRFKITSTNNHVNNYEIDDLPLPNLEGVKVEAILNSDLVIQNFNICKMFGLNESEALFLLHEHHSEKEVSEALLNVFV